MRSLTAALVAALVVLPTTPAWAANQAPVAVDDTVSYRNTGGIDHAVDALANDSDPDGDPLTYTAVTAAAKGNAYLQDGTLFYKPYLGNTGTDSFTYTVTDGQGNTATATVTATLWVDPALPGDVAISSTAPGSVTLTWSAAARAAEYRVYRNGQQVGSTPDLSWTDTGLVDTTRYRYQIGSVNGGGYEAIWWHAPTVYREAQLPAPTAVAVTVTDDPTTLSLTWSADGKPGPWNVYRDGALLGSSPAPAFEDTGLVTGREYSYQVQHALPSTTTAVYPPSALSAPATGTPSELSAIGRFFRDHGGSSGDLGPVTVPERAIPGGRQQDHQRGVILQQDGGEPFSVTGSFHTAFAGAGGVAGDLGFPIMQAECGLRDSGCGQLFEGGSIWSSAATRPLVVPLVVEDGWAALDWEEGPLGYPVDDPVALTGGLYQDFQGGAVYWSPATGSHGVASPLYERWAAAGYESGALGYPIADEVETVKGIRQSFTGGTIWWSPSRGAQVVTGRMSGAWQRAGWAEGPLGEPTAPEAVLRGGRAQAFTGGAIYWSPTTGAHPVRGAIRTAWTRYAAHNGFLGYPVTDEVPLVIGGGRYQNFRGGAVYWSPTTGAHPVRGAIRAAWARTGWERGRLGYPTTDEAGTTATRRQGFQGGTITLDVRTGRTTVTYR